MIYRCNFWFWYILLLFRVLVIKERKMNCLRLRDLEISAQFIVIKDCTKSKFFTLFLKNIHYFHKCDNNLQYICNWKIFFVFLESIFMLLLVLCLCENNMDTVLRFVKLASSFHILHCFNELCNVTIQFCMFSRSSLKM